MAENRFKNSIESAAENTMQVLPSQDVVNVEEFTQKAVLETPSSILDKITAKVDKQRGTNHNIYLSYEVSEKLQALVKKTKKSKSKLIDEILREIL